MASRALSSRRTLGLVRRASSMAGPLAESLERLKQTDPNAVLQLPFWPSHAQPGFIAIRTFLAGMDCIQLTEVKWMGMASLRLHWWRDAIDSCYGSQDHRKKLPDHHLIQGLRPLIKQHKLSKYYFTRIIEASWSHCCHPRFADLSALVKYSRSTTYAGLSLLAQLLTSSEPAWRGDVSLRTIDHSLTHLATFLTIIRLLERMPHYVDNHNTHIVPSELLECPDEALIKFFADRYSPAPLDDSRGQLPARSLLNLVFLAWSELVAAREVITLDPSHRHSSTSDFRSHKNASRIESHIFSGRPHLPTVTIPPGLVPLFLAATPARSQLSKISKIILTSSDMVNKRRQNRTTDLANWVAQKPNWTAPFKLWFNYYFNKL
ncbi:hypothetical protein PTTG_04217 [Puccinia triticina 1-1 BBBD Race 1]|uniref:Uncharacterized protein n=2 Tax=Puccinia triticina TaxID=208348 RepID=A0A180GPF8_PUCT1|nr:uncharacterized protein PtA15_12A288 [Puccinia triticina]OAV94706.1 hypothetical protein PTTG_04217 [Puccinia triticina 1-1 BBBD Race 1]WAQ90300.1 hypothetical protein PtA15_12A288 [Puccinia triticina]WAR61606.1 hypothetical protein PtB15_12B296 [Puccinia triticina]